MVTKMQAEAPYEPQEVDLPQDWAALPDDILCLILGLLPQADILRGAALVCASWRRLALDEPLLWRRIDLTAEEDDPPAGWAAMTCAAVRHSAGGCESFRGRVDLIVLFSLAHRYDGPTRPPDPSRLSSTYPY
jgi:hypothetical protein